MSEFSTADCDFMAQAIRLARRGMYTCKPNPLVGCILVSGGDLVGRGWHQRAGSPHAEVNALEDAGNRARGATAYVTLEPCVHHGRTGPCVAALVKAGIKEVIAPGNDPNPEVAGQGYAALSEAGINVRTGLMRAAAESLNEGFFSRHLCGRPFVRLKVAASLDGCTTMANGESQWITSADARRDVHRLRARAGALLTGVGTVLADDPALTVRDIANAAEVVAPMRVILDSSLRTPIDARVFDQPGETSLVCCDDTRRNAFEALGATVVKISGKQDKPEPGAVLRYLASRGVNDVLVEAGAKLGGSLLQDNVVDELIIYQAPHLMGSRTRGMFETPLWQDLQDRLAFEVIDSRRVGADTRLTLRPTTGRTHA